MTTNREWKEIKEQLKPEENAHDRPDIVTRVFKMKLDELIEDITKKNIFGKIEAYMYTVEFQKRDLPHAHILVILKNKKDILEPTKWNLFTCAQIPNKEKNPRLYNLVQKHMIHSCKVGRCLESKKLSAVCTKRFPRDFSDVQQVDDMGYPIYYRPNNGYCFLS